MSEAPAMPEHDKMSAISDQSNSFFEILEFLESKGYFVTDDTSFPITTNTLATTIAEFFDIDYKEFHAEKDRLVKWMRGEYVND